MTSAYTPWRRWLFEIAATADAELADLLRLIATANQKNGTTTRAEAELAVMEYVREHDRVTAD